MTNRTITARDTNLNAVSGGATYVNGVATVDDATEQGKRSISFAKRHGWAVSGGIATAVDLTPANGEAVIRWTDAEKKAYLDGRNVTYPANASSADLLNAIKDGFDMKAQGGSGSNMSAGHTSQTIPPEGAPPVSNPDKPDDPTKTPLWVTPMSDANEALVSPPTVTTAPVAVSKIAPATATFTVAGAGSGTPTYQWQRQAKGTGAYVDVAGAHAASYTTPATTVADNNGDKYRVTITNEHGSVTTTGVALTVTAS